MKDQIFNLVMSDCQHQFLDDGAVIVFFPKLNYAHIDDGKRQRWIYGTSMSSILATYYMELDEVMYG